MKHRSQNHSWLKSQDTPGNTHSRRKPDKSPPEPQPPLHHPGWGESSSQTVLITCCAKTKGSFQICWRGHSRMEVAPGGIENGLHQKWGQWIGPSGGTHQPITGVSLVRCGQTQKVAIVSPPKCQLPAGASHQVTCSRLG